MTFASGITTENWLITDQILLSLAFVYDVIDQHNAAMAIRMFDHDIKEYFISKGYTESAHFCLPGSQME